MSSSIAHGRRNFKSALERSRSLQRLLNTNRLRQHCRDCRHRRRRCFWSSRTTLLTFLLQVASPVKTLRAAVAEILGHLAVQQGRVAGRSADPSAFSQARQRLPESVFHAVFQDSVRLARTLAGEGNRWRDWRVIVIDGSSVSMPDTAELQNAFPQPSGQAEGCGFPVARLVVFFDWRSGAAIDVRAGSLHDSEAALFRQMLDHLGPGTLALADRYYCSYVDIVRIVQRGGDVVFRLHQRRSHDFRTGARLGENDTLVTWRRPERWLPSFGVTREEFEALPEEITLRMVRSRRGIKGFRSSEIVIVTTILDPEEAPADELLALYRDRWLAELNLRSLKITLGMDVLRGHSVDVVRKEIFVHLLLYNIIRLLMWEAARLDGRDPQRLSFAGTLHRLQSLGAHVLDPHAGRAIADRILITLLSWIDADEIPHRPDRFEPRRVKRRPKQYSRLKKPRSWYHAHGDKSCR